jgi:type II secretory ATPase GspE/PulE/Tfp pilus assembly ATPase PilB-like protein
MKANIKNKEPQIIRHDWRNIIASRLSSLLDSYHEEASDSDRRRSDWDYCNQGLLTESDLLKLYSESAGIESIGDEDLSETAVEKFPGISSEFIENSCCLPLSWDDENIVIAIADPYLLDRIKYLFKSVYGKKTSFCLWRRSVLERIIKNVYGIEQAGGNIAEGKNFLQNQDESEESLRNLASEATIVRLVNEMFSRAFELNASDIHIEPEENTLTIRFRIDGILHETMTAPLSQYPAIASRIKLIGGLNIAERRLPQDGRTNFKVGKNNVDVRISTLPTINGESIVLRLLRKDNSVFDMAKIGMSEEIRKKFEKLIQMPHGIILVVGPTGSGKTTTLYSAIRKINSSEKKIITIEDPIEYRIEKLSQIQVNPKIGLDFANGLRHIVRQDPDVILVGEIRDKETAEIAVHASLTGHLVFSTLHTNDALGAVTRLLDIGVEGFLISASLKAVLSQRLVRKICLECGGTGQKAGLKCKNCGGAGYKGRTGIYELLNINDEMAAAIAKNADGNTIASIAKKNGMKTLVEDGMEKIAAGITNEAEVARVTINV